MILRKVKRTALLARASPVTPWGCVPHLAPTQLRAWMGCGTVPRERGKKERWRSSEHLEQDAAIKETFGCQDMNTGGYSNEK